MPEFRGRFGGGRGRGGGRGERYGGDADFEAHPEAEKFRKLFIGGLAYETTEATLKGYYEAWGEVVDIVVMKDPATKKSRGFGFVTYKESSQVDDAQENRPHEIDGREVECKRAMPRDGNESQELIKKLFCGGLSADTTENDLQEYFQAFGNIVKVDIIMEKDTGRNKGFGFVEFDDYDPVDKLVLQKRHPVGGKTIDVSKALPKGDKDGEGGGRRGGRGGRGRGGGFGGSSGYGGGSSWSSGGGGGGGYGGSGGYGSMGSGYGDSYGGGPMKSGHSQRSQGPYGGGYSSGGGSGGYSQGYGSGGGSGGGSYNQGYGSGSGSGGGGYSQSYGSGSGSGSGGGGYNQNYGSSGGYGGQGGGW